MSEHVESSSWPIWRKSLLIWAALLALLASTLVLAYVPMGAFNTPIGLLIAVAKAALVAALFMELRSSRALIRIAAGAGLFWLVFMYLLTLTDYLSRPLWI